MRRSAGDYSNEDTSPTTELVFETHSYRLYYRNLPLIFSHRAFVGHGSWTGKLGLGITLHGIRVYATGLKSTTHLPFLIPWRKVLIDSEGSRLYIVGTNWSVEVFDASEFLFKVKDYQESHGFRETHTSLINKRPTSEAKNLSVSFRPYFIAGLFLVILGNIVWGFDQAQRGVDLAKNGVITDARIERIGHHEGVCENYFTYYVNDIQLHAKRKLEYVSPRQCEEFDNTLVGSTFTIKYDPNNPLRILYDSDEFDDVQFFPHFFPLYFPIMTFLFIMAYMILSLVFFKYFNSNYTYKS